MHDFLYTKNLTGGCGWGNGKTGGFEDWDPRHLLSGFACISRIPYSRELKYDCSHASNASTKSSSFTAWLSNFSTVLFPVIPL